MLAYCKIWAKRVIEYLYPKRIHGGHFKKAQNAYIGVAYIGYIAQKRTGGGIKNCTFWVGYFR